VNDRGPYHDGRIIDVSEAAADALGFRRAGTARVRVDYVGRASVNGSDDRKLLATLRDDGRPAGLNGAQAPVMLAEAGQHSLAAAPLASPRSAGSAGPTVLASALPMPLEPAKPERATRDEQQRHMEGAPTRPGPVPARPVRVPDASVPTRPAALAGEPSQPIRLLGTAPRENSAPIRVAGVAPTHLPVRVGDVQPLSAPLSETAHASGPRSAPLPPGRPRDLAAKPTGPQEGELVRITRKPSRPD